MISRLLQSIRTRGVIGTAAAIRQIALVRLHRVRFGQHLSVPIEMLKHPEHAKAWLHDRFSKTAPARQGLPWIAWPCIDFIDSYLRPEHHVFEWGGGGSTIFFLRKGCRLTTVESSSKWVEILNKEVSNQATRAKWDLRFVPVSGNSDPNINRYIDQVTSGGPWDLVLVDGWSRIRCLQAAIPWVKPGGVLVLDNADQQKFSAAPQVMQDWQHRLFAGLGVARTWVTRTDAYIKPM